LFIKLKACNCNVTIVQLRLNARCISLIILKCSIKFASLTVSSKNSRAHAIRLDGVYVLGF